MLFCDQSPEQEEMITNHLNRLLKDLITNVSNAKYYELTKRNGSYDDEFNRKKSWAKAFHTRHNIFKLLQLNDPNEKQ